MSDTTLTIIGSVVAVAALAVMVGAVVFFWKLAGRVQQTSQRRLDEQAAERGWQVDHKREIGKVEQRWSGTTEAVSWTAHYTGVEDNSADHSYRRHMFRWTAPLANGPAVPLVLIHDRSSLHGVDTKTQELPGLLRGVASAMIDRVAEAYFGPAGADVDLSRWAAVDGHGLPGMRVLTASPDPSALLVCQRLSTALAQAAPLLQAAGEVPAILIRRDGVHLAAKTQAGDTEIDLFVTLGVGIARSVSTS